MHTNDLTAAPLALPTDHAGHRKLVTRSVAVSPADALDRLGLSTGSADAFLTSGAWVGLGRDRVRLVPLASGKLRARHAYAVVETEHHNILTVDDGEPLTETTRAV